MIILVSLAVFVLQFIENVLWAYYIKYASEEKLLQAAIFGELITIAGIVTFYSWLENYIFVIPTILGGFLGTYYSKRIRKLFKVPEKQK